MTMANYYHQKPVRYSMVGDDLTDAEVQAIIEAEIKKVPMADLGKIVVGDFSALNTIVRNSVKQICISGGKKEITSWLPYVIAVAGGLIILYLVVK